MPAVPSSYAKHGKLRRRPRRVAIYMSGKLVCLMMFFDDEEEEEEIMPSRAFPCVGPL